MNAFNLVLNCQIKQLLLRQACETGDATFVVTGCISILHRNNDIFCLDATFQRSEPTSDNPFHVHFGVHFGVHVVMLVITCGRRQCPRELASGLLVLGIAFFKIFLMRHVALPDQVVAGNICHRISFAQRPIRNHSMQHNKPFAFRSTLAHQFLTCAVAHPR
jgi:hypothetical protein